MITKTELRWSFLPADLFEPNTQAVTVDGCWTFCHGFALLTLSGPADPVPDRLIEGATTTLEQLLTARAFNVDRRWELIGHANTYQHSAAGVSHVIVPITGAGALVSGPASIDVVIADGNGRVLHDSAKARRDAASKALQAQARRLELSTDLAFLFDRYSHALAHPDTSLIHLFEIVERLEDIFPKGDAIKILAIRGPRRILGMLANDAPIIEGRHAGQHDPVLLRHVTLNEENEAREAARTIISAFEAYIDKAAGPTRSIAAPP